MNRRALLVLFALVTALFASGCGHRWMVVRQAAPNPLTGANRFALDAVHYETLRVGGISEAEYLAGKTPEQQASFQADKQGFMQQFGSALVEKAQGLQIAGMPAPDAQTFVVKPTLTWIEPGFYAGVARHDTEAEINIQIFTQQGQIVDEIVVRSRIAATLTNPSSGGRLRDAGNDLGRVAANYLLTRTKGE